MSSRPDFGILFYPVISMQDEIAHKGSRSKRMGAACVIFEEGGHTPTPSTKTPHGKRLSTLG